jgi:hypothetical protein
MYLLVNVLEQTEHLPAILEEFAGLNIKGSTVINSTGMGRVLMQIGAATPGIEGIKKTLRNMEPSNKMIFTVVRDKETIDKAICTVKSLCGDLTEPGKGILFALPLSFVDGLSD